MASITVFVDDAVTGDLPYVCTKTGDPADGMLEVHHEVGRRAVPGIAWVLVLFGPVGWGVLLFLWIVLDRGEILTVRLPMSETAVVEHRSARRRRAQALTVAAAVAVVALVLVVTPVDQPVASVMVARVAALALVGVGVVAGATAWRASHDCRRWSVALSLDASRRWVTLDGVHDRFAAQVEARRRTVPPGLV